MQHHQRMEENFTVLKFTISNSHVPQTQASKPSDLTGPKSTEAYYGTYTPLHQ